MKRYISIIGEFDPLFEKEELFIKKHLSSFNNEDQIYIKVFLKTNKSIIKKVLVNYFFNIFKDLKIKIKIYFSTIKNLKENMLSLSKYFKDKILIVYQDNFLLNSEYDDVLTKTKIKKSNIKFLKKDQTYLSYKKSELQIINCSYDTLKFISVNKYYLFKKIAKFITKQRYLHSLSVANLAYSISLSNKLKYSKLCFIAGVIHDVAKDLDNENSIKLMKKYYPKYLYLNKYIYHQFLSVIIIKKHFNINNTELFNSIIYHTTGNKKLTSMGKIIYSADKIEPLRNYDSSKLIKECKKNFNNGFIEVFKDSIKYYNSHNIDYKNELTNNCINYYLKGDFNE